MSMYVKVKSNINEVTRALGQQAIVALEECGLAAEGYAKRLCAVDTGLLRNSITHAIGGGPAAIDSYKSSGFHANTAATRRAGTAGKAVPIRTGSYEGNAPNEDERAVYIGTNVEYAPYVEMGTSSTPAQPFIQPAVKNHGNEYKQILQSHLQK